MNKVIKGAFITRLKPEVKEEFCSYIHRGPGTTHSLLQDKVEKHDPDPDRTELLILVTGIGGGERMQ